MHVVVIGGGVIGLCSTREMLRQGADVTLIERGRCGEATSLRNAGQIVPSLGAPLAAPGVLKQSLGWLLKANSPFRLRPRVDPRYLGWLLRFARNTSQKTYRGALKAAAAFGQDSVSLYDRLRADGVAFEMHHQGLLFAALSKTALEHDIRLYQELEAIGYPRRYEVLDGDQVRDFEPALSADIAGGVFVEGECHVRPESLMQGLRDDVRARGARLMEETSVRALRPRRPAGWRLQTSADTVAGDRVLVAAGYWSRKLLGDLGVRIPLEAGKGYSITTCGRGAVPGRPLKFTEPELVVTPYDGAVRVSGLFDLGSTHTRLVKRRVNAVVQTVQPYLRDWQPQASQLEWAGLRPATPDSLPIIDAVPGYHNLYVAAGHGILGITHGPATGQAVAPLVLEDRRAAAIEPFGLGRF